MESADLLWAVEECGRADFGDLRLTHRMTKVTAALAAQPAASIPTALHGCWVRGRFVEGEVGLRNELT